MLIAMEQKEFFEGAERGLSWVLSSQLTARRAEAFGAFSDGTLDGSDDMVSLGSLASSFGIIAAEEFLRLDGRKG